MSQVQGVHYLMTKLCTLHFKYYTFSMPKNTNQATIDGSKYQSSKLTTHCRDSWIFLFRWFRFSFQIIPQNTKESAIYDIVLSTSRKTYTRHIQTTWPDTNANIKMDSWPARDSKKKIHFDFIYLTCIEWTVSLNWNIMPSGSTRL